jgi:hypothetical protein
MNALSAEALVSTLRRYGIGVHPLEWRVPPIETYPRVVAFAQTHVGKLLLFVLFAGFTKYLAGGPGVVMAGAAAAVSLASDRRRQAALLCTAALLVLGPEWFEYRAVYAVTEREFLGDVLRPGYVRAATLIACVPLAVAILYLARRFRDHGLGRRPIVAQHLLFFVILGVAASPLLRGIPLVLLWSLTAVFAAYFWFLAYALIDQRRREPAPILFHLATFHPFFGSTTVPMAKGASNWTSVEAKTEEELAVTQLKGLKLLAWAIFLRLLLRVYRTIVYAKMGITPLGIAFDRFVADGISPGSLGALSIVANFFEQLLLMAIWGHVIIATARLAGYRLLRNTWRPLSSPNIAEFWNRYFYYFKEILVNVYFYPTYVRWFKRHNRLRVAFATFIAAGVGNFFFHFLLENYRVARDGLGEALGYMQTYAFYCGVLVSGIVVSQLRARRIDPGTGWVRRQFVPALGVMLFYCFLSFFDGPQRHVALRDHFAFLLEVFGASRWI